MGALIRLILQGIKFGGPAAIGYFTNDFAGWLANITGTSDKVVKSDQSGYKPWFLAIVFILGGGIVYMLLKLFSGRKKIFMLSLAVLCVDHFCFGAINPHYQTCTLLFSIAASVSDSKSIPYVPQFISFNISTVPSAFKIEVAGDGVIFSIDGTGLTNLNGIRQVGALPSNQYIFEIANGFIEKNTTFSITNAAAAQLDIYGWSERKGSGYVMHNSAKAFANASLLVDDFFYAAFPSAGATDNFTVSWANGKTETMRRIELESRLAYKQQVAATRYNVDNINREVSKIQFNGVADQNVYYTRWNLAKGTVRQTL